MNKNWDTKAVVSLSKLMQVQRNSDGSLSSAAAPLLIKSRQLFRSRLFRELPVFPLSWMFMIWEVISLSVWRALYPNATFKVKLSDFTDKLPYLTAPINTVFCNIVVAVLCDLKIYLQRYIISCPGSTPNFISEAPHSSQWVFISNMFRFMPTASCLSK